MKTVPTSYRQWVLSKPLTGCDLTTEHFRLEERQLPALGAGQALVRVKLINLHSGTRSRLESGRAGGMSGMTPVGGTDRTNYACAEVVASRDPAFAEGDVIACQAGWQDYQVISSADAPLGGYAPANAFIRAVNGTNAPMTYRFRPEMTATWAPEVLMNTFGTSGMTAYFGIRSVGPVMPADRVLVAAAGGAVGNIAAQLARAAGASVTGLAGGAGRCARITEILGLDDCIDYRADDLEAQLRAAFPQGIDVFADGVGGNLTELVVSLMKDNGRLLSYGSSAALYSTGPDARGGGFTSLRRAFGMTEAAERAARQKNIKIDCFIVYDFYAERIQAENDLSRLLWNGAIQPLSSITRGIEHLPEAVIGMYSRPRLGKAQVDFEEPARPR